MSRKYVDAAALSMERLDAQLRRHLFLRQHPAETVSAVTDALGIR